MTDNEVIQAAKFSLFPLRVETLPSENVLRKVPDEPFVVGDATVWYDEAQESFAVSGSKTCKTDGVGFCLFETYEELAEELR